MHPIRRSGVTSGEIIVFLLLLSAGIGVALYLNQKPTVIVKTVIVQPNPPAPPVEETPAPAPPAPIVVKETPSAEVSLPIATVIVAPTVPACVPIEKKLRIAQDAAAQTLLNIAAAKRAALQELYQSSDYIAAKADSADKKQSKQTVADNLQKDRVAGADTDHDITDMQAASAAWVVSTGALAKMEDDAIASSAQVNEQLRNLKDIKTQIADLQTQLGNYISKEIHTVCRDADCQINHVSLDASDWTIYVELTPGNNPNTNAMADKAVHEIGTILETLTKTPFTWKKAQFKVFSISDATHQAQFATTYLRSTIAQANFQATHVSNPLFPPLHGPAMAVGQIGMLVDVEIVQIIDETNLLAQLSDDSNLIWIKGINTIGRVDDTVIDIDVPMEVTATTKYKTALGVSHTVFLLQPSTFHQVSMPGDYFDNAKLMSLADKIWLNPHIDQLQGRPPVPDSIVLHPGVPLPQLFNTLAIGGYTRSDGSACPVTFVHSPHTIEFAQPDPPQNKTPPLPSRVYSNNAGNPGFGF